MARSRSARIEPENSAPSIQDAAPKMNAPALVAQTQSQAETDSYPRCNHCDGPKTVVLGGGNPRAELVFVGEAPGELMDTTALPRLPGPAGELLDKMIQAMGLTRDQVYISKLVKCHPSENRDPETSNSDEIAACIPFLQRQLDAIQPKVIVALGDLATRALLQAEPPTSHVRGKFHEYPLAGAERAKLMPTFHPTHLLRNPEAKREAWADLQAVARELGIAIPTPVQKKPQSKG